jgi:phosphate transport system substrate-binding protein
VNSAQLAREVGYTPLPAEAYKAAWARFQQRNVGTVFGGTPEVGVKIMDLLTRELKS